MKPMIRAENQWEDLFARVFDGGGSVEDIAQLHALLRGSPEARDAWIRLTHLHAELASGVLLEARGEVVHASQLRVEEGLVESGGASMVVEAPWRRQFARIAAALVAGLLLGSFGTSALRAVTEPRAGKVATLLADSFEAEVAPLRTGPSEQTGVWSGDVTELVGGQQGVQPRSGKRMLRFVSSAFEGKTAAVESYIADVYRLLDVRSFAKELVSGDFSVRVSAHFNARADSEPEPYSAGVYLHALSAETVRKGLLQSSVQRLVQESLAVSIANTSLDRDPTTWQQAMGELRLPPQTEFVWVHFMVTHPSRRAPEGPRAFGGHFLDDVEAVLLRRASSP